MDRTQAWRLMRLMGKEGSVQGRRFGRLVAEKWKAEAARRKKVRRDMKAKVRDAQKALRAARRADPERTDSATHRAERKLREVRRRVPNPLWLLTAKTAGMLSVAAYLGLPRVPSVAWLWSAVAVAAAAVSGLVWLAIKAFGTDMDAGELIPTAEETALLERLQPEHWREHAKVRGLEGTLTGRPELTDAGITVAVRLDGQWTLGKLRSAEESVRALLGARTGLPMLVESGDSGGWAKVSLRTRSAADTADFTWRPGAPWGVNTVTGEPVDVPLGQRMLIAGRSGAGKSWSARPLLHGASEGEHNRLVIIDLKWVEARNWEHRARTATTPEDAEELVEELTTEMTERLMEVPRGRDTIELSARRPRITVFVDEGSEVVSAAKKALAGLESIARMGRAACIDIWWATQKPTMSGSSPGIPAQIAPQLSTVISLAVSTATEARTVLGEDAQAKGWHPEDLPAPGYALVRSGPGSKPQPIRTRALSPADVIALPDRPIWEYGAEVPAASPPPPGRPKLTLVKDSTPAESGTAPAPRPAPVPVADGADGKVLQALGKLRPPVRQKDLVEVSGLPKGTVSKAVKRLVDSGSLVRHEDGTVSAPTAGEVSA